VLCCSPGGASPPGLRLPFQLLRVAVLGDCGALISQATGAVVASPLLNLGIPQPLF
jgi:hypothetical protein